MQGSASPGARGWTGPPGQPGTPGGRGWFQVFVFALLFQARRKARHILFVAVSFFLAFLNDPVAIIFHYFLQVPLEEQDHQARLAPLESEVCTVNFCRK